MSNSLEFVKFEDKWSLCGLWTPRNFIQNSVNIYTFREKETWFYHHLRETYDPKDEPS